MGRLTRVDEGVSMKRQTMIRSGVGMLLALAAMGVSWVAASEDSDHARELYEQGSIVSLEQIIEAARARHPGRVLEAELERESDGYYYEVELVDEHGVVWELEYDATDGTLLRDRRDY